MQPLSAGGWAVLRDRLRPEAPGVASPYPIAGRESANEAQGDVLFAFFLVAMIWDGVLAFCLAYWLRIGSAFLRSASHRSGTIRHAGHPSVTMLILYFFRGCTM